MTEDQVPFPPQLSSVRVWNPLNRYAWDLLILLLIVCRRGAGETSPVDADGRTVRAAVSHATRG